MDNEMKNGRRELSLDEMDKVSGGAWTYDLDTDCISINGGAPTSWGTFCEMMYTIAEGHGIDVAIDFMKNTVGWTDSHMVGSKTKMSDRDYMGVILAHFDKTIHGTKH